MIDPEFGEPYKGDISKLKYYKNPDKYVKTDDTYYMLSEETMRTIMVMKEGVSETRLLMQNDDRLLFETNFNTIYNNILEADILMPNNLLLRYYFLAIEDYKTLQWLNAYYFSEDLQSKIHQQESKRIIDKLTVAMSNNDDISKEYYFISENKYNHLDDTEKTNWEIMSVPVANSNMGDYITNEDKYYCPIGYKNYIKNFKPQPEEAIRHSEEETRKHSDLEEEMIPIKPKPQTWFNNLFGWFAPIGGKRRTRKYKYKRTPRRVKRKSNQRRTRRKQTKLK
jgi:hypothetical protein